MLKVYGFDFSSPVNKVRMTANLLEIEYEYIRLNPMKGEHKAQSYIKHHPAGKVPVIDDNGFILFESNAIIRYLGKKHPSCHYSSDLEQAALTDQWIDFSSNQVGVNVAKIAFNKLFAEKIGKKANLNSIKEGQNFLLQYLPIFEKQLSEQPYLVDSQITLADICLLSCLDPVEMIEFDLDPYPKIIKWRNLLKQKEFYQKVHKSFGEPLFTKA